MRQLWFTREAEWDLVETEAWYAERSQSLAETFIHGVDEALKRIAKNPKHFPKRYRNVRTGYLDRFPFGIHFIESESGIVVIGVFHFSRDPRNWDERL